MTIPIASAASKERNPNSFLSFALTQFTSLYDSRIQKQLGLVRAASDSLINRSTAEGIPLKKPAAFPD